MIQYSIYKCYNLCLGVRLRHLGSADTEGEGVESESKRHFLQCRLGNVAAVP